MKTKKPPIGRRALPEELRRDCKLSLFFTKSEMQAIESIAGSEDILRFSRRILLEKAGIESIRI